METKPMLDVKPKKEDMTMHDKKALCEKIREVFPDIGECGIDVDVEYDEAEKVWIVDLKQDQHALKTHLEPDEADACMDGKQCVSLGIQIGQLKDNIKTLKPPYRAFNVKD